MRKRLVKMAAAMTVFILTGCSAETVNETNSQTNTEVQEEAQETTEEEPYLITMTMEGDQQEDFPRIMDRVNEILRRDLNMELNLIVLPWVPPPSKSS